MSSNGFKYITYLVQQILCDQILNYNKLSNFMKTNFD